MSLIETLQSRLDPRIRELTSWRQIKKVADANPGLLTPPIDPKKIPDFKCWRWTKTYTFLGSHKGLDYHVYEKIDNRLAFIPLFTEVTSILPGVVIYKGPFANPYEEGYGNTVCILHSYPSNGKYALLSCYSHISSKEEIDFTQSPPAFTIGRYTNLSLMNSSISLSHLHFSLAQIKTNVLSKIIKKYEIEGKILSLEAAITCSLLMRVDPWKIFPPRTKRYAWFDDNGIYKSTKPYPIKVTYFNLLDECWKTKRI